MAQSNAAGGGDGDGAAPPEEPLLLENHPTRAIFRQLGIKIHSRVLTEGERRTPLDNMPARLRWFFRHQHGFYYCGNLHPSVPAYKSVLLKDATLPWRCYVKKCINAEEYDWVKPADEFGEWRHRDGPYHKNWGNIPPEIRFSRLRDDFTEFQLPRTSYFPNLRAWEFLRAPDNPHERPDQIVLYYEYLNGKSLRNLLQVMSNPNCRQALPEAFIWHVTAELTFALVSLWTGWDRAQILQHARTRYVREGDSPPSPRPPLAGCRGWVPIVHRNITLDNVYLHFPYGHDSRFQEPEYNFMFPWVVLCNFSEANTVRDHKRRWNLSRGVYAKTNSREGAPFTGRKPNILEDAHAVGVILRRLVSFLDGVRDTGSLDYHVDDYPMDRYDEDSIGNYSDVEPDDPNRHYYTHELMEFLGQWEWTLDMRNPDDSIEALMQRYNNSWTRIMRHEPDAMIDPAIQVMGNARAVHSKRESEYLRGRPTISQLRNHQEYKDQVGTHVQQVRVPMDFELMPWSPHSRDIRTSLEEIKTEMAYHKGTYQPIWLKWSDVISVTRVPGQYRRLFGPPFHCGSRPTQGRAVAHCDCDCVEDCICGCHARPPSRIPSPNQDIDSEDPEESDSEPDPPGPRRPIRVPSPTGSEAHAEYLGRWFPSPATSDRGSKSTDGDSATSVSDSTFSDGQLPPSPCYQSPQRGPSSTPVPLALYRRVFVPSSGSDPRSRAGSGSSPPAGSASSDPFDLVFQLDPSLVQGGTPRRVLVPIGQDPEINTPFRRGVLKARWERPGTGRSPAKPSDDSGDSGGGGLGFEIFIDPDDPTAAELANYAQGMLDQVDAANPAPPPRVTSPFAQGVGMARNHGVARAHLENLSAIQSANTSGNQSGSSGSGGAVNDENAPP